MKGQPEIGLDIKTTIVDHAQVSVVVPQGKRFNRVVLASGSGWEYECNQRHVEVLIEELGLLGPKPLSTPGYDEVIGDEPTPFPLLRISRLQKRVHLLRCADVSTQQSSNVAIALLQVADVVLLSV